MWLVLSCRGFALAQAGEGASAHGVNAQSDQLELLKQTQNPGAPLASVPFQFNWNGNIGRYDRTQWLLNVQPVLPVPFSKTWALITRWIFPVLTQPDVTQPTGSTLGIGDLNSQLFLAANLPIGLTVAAGMSLTVPTATDSVLGQGKFALGPTALLVYTHGILVAGVLSFYNGSVAGDSSRSAVEFFSTQVFVNLNLPHGTFLVTAPTFTYDYKANHGVVPVGGGVGKLFLFDRIPVSISLQMYANVARPEGAPAWTFRTAVQFLYPQPVLPPVQH